MTSGIPQDFGDWISPILVKELRQGLRTRVFTVAFIAMQAVLLLFMLAGLREDADAEFVTGAFWFLLFLVMVIITPLRGLNTLSSEVKQNTLELLSLTRLDALRICFGKWAALFAQALLFTIAVLPYVVLRYFAGGIDLFQELSLLGSSLAASAVLCAFSIALSSLASAVARSFFVVCLVIFLSMSGPIWFARGFLPGGSPSFMNGWGWVVILLLAAYLTFFSISTAASRIAAPAENYSTLRRLVGLAAIALSLLIGFTRTGEFLPLAYGLSALLALDALTERSSDLPAVHGPFLRWGLAGRLPQFLLTPGWQSGGPLVSLVIAILAATIIGMGSSAYPLQVVSVHLSLGGLVLLPVLVTELFLSEMRDRLTPYFFLQAAQFALGGFFLLLGKGGKSEGFLWVGSVLPTTSVFMASDSEYRDSPYLVAGSGVSFLAIAVALILISRGYWEKVKGH